MIALTMHNLARAKAVTARDGSCHWVTVTDKTGNDVTFFLETAAAAHRIANAVNAAISDDMTVEAAE